MRLFIAIKLSESMSMAIGDVQSILKRQGVRGNYTPRENLHLTLAFIGEYNNPDRVLDIIEHMPMKPFELSLNGIGAFGDLWWIGLEPSKELQGYVRQLRHEMAEADIPYDRKQFSPHITILRRASIEIGKIKIQPVERASMVAVHASLMRSERGRNGMIYTEII